MKNLAIQDEVNKVVAVLQIQSDKLFEDLKPSENEEFKNKFLQAINEDLCLDDDADSRIYSIYFDNKSYTYHIVVETVERGQDYEDKNEWNYIVSQVAIY